jgi:23S rRNA (guanine2445-N2)-methyltransferase / 23S rRNA (guanine2069-N7)-methyltransferase
MQWLRHETRRFGLIFCDPPTFSNSKRMARSFDVQRDHVELIKAAGRLLTRDGDLIFSNNNRRFKLERHALEDFEVEEISKQTLSEDFARNPRIHNCWRIRKKR